MKANTNKPRVLVVLPTLGTRNDLLKLTLESIKSQGKNLCDIVMVCPLRNKETIKLGKQYGAHFVDDPGSMSSAVNAGVAFAKPEHEYLTWIGDDDLFTPNSIKTSLEALDKNPNAKLAYGYCDYINTQGNHVFTSKAGNLAPWIMTWGPNLMPLIGTVFRTSELKKAGEFDVNLKYSMDLDMFLRLKKMGPFVNTKTTLAAFRWHPDSSTVRNRAVVIPETEMVKRKHLPKFMQPLSPIWDFPVRVATKFAADRVTARAKKRT